MTTPRIHTAARSIGLARGALEDSIRYVQERRQFDRPIGDFQAIRFKIAKMASEIETCRALMYQVAADADAGERSDMRAAMVKYMASEMSERVTSEGMQIHGGAGYTTDFPIERYWRDARLTKIFEGTSEIMQRIISDSLLPPSDLR
jgi:alkylation response protein AidB-like acyl-CoA dehydrogenase